MTPHFFYISDIANSSSFNGKIFRKKSMLEKFRANVLKSSHWKSLKWSKKSWKKLGSSSFGAFPCKILTEISARISASFWPARLPRSQRDLKISAAKNSPRFWPRSHQDLRISARRQVRSRRDIKILEAKKISPRKLEVFLAMFPRYFKMSILRFRRAFHKFVD